MTAKNAARDFILILSVRERLRGGRDGDRIARGATPSDSKLLDGTDDHAIVHAMSRGITSITNFFSHERFLDQTISGREKDSRGAARRSHQAPSDL